MLGKLFSSAASTLTTRGTLSDSTRPTTSLDSTQEDIHTRHLLFPDTDALYQHQHDQVFPLSAAAAATPMSANAAYDSNAEIDLELRDVRMIVMQEDSTGYGRAALLYDSHPLQPSAVNRQPSNSTSISPEKPVNTPRKISLGQSSRPQAIQNAGVRNGGGAFDRSRSNHIRAASFAETEEQKAAREHREEMRTFSDCIFGSSNVKCKSMGTKMHIVPTESKVSSSDRYGSLGRSSMKSSKLSQSYTFENSVISPSVPTFPSTAPSSERRKVLITRIFQVKLSSVENVPENSTPTQQSVRTNEINGYPFPRVEDFPPGQPKQRRTPMYAIGLVITLPPSSQVSPAPPKFRDANSYGEQDSLPSSFSSARRAGWTMLGSGFGVESLDSSYTSDIDHIDTITQHWDIIMRTLSHLQAVTTEAILTMLKQADIASPDPVQLRSLSGNVSVAGKRANEEPKFIKPRPHIAKLVSLQANALANDRKVKASIDAARHRIVDGMKSLQVVTAQGRWGIWRDEARWVGKWAGGKEQGFFFFNLLTAFLGNHTEWLQELGPAWYRRRHYQQQRMNREEDTTIPARTVIVANDKMAARRLVFLLSAFLPANQPVAATRPHRPSTSASFGPYSQSPPSYVPILREESLRRKMNKRSGSGRRSHSRTLSFPAAIVQNNQPASPAAVVVDTRHNRKSSDASLMMKSANLPIPGSDIGSRKSSAATTATATPATTMPHFSTRRHTRGTGPLPRPGSSGSLATDDLLRSLKRGDNTSHYSIDSIDSQGPNSRWSSMMSGFWSSKRRDSTANTETTPPSLDGLKVDDNDKDTASRGKLAEMVEDASRFKAAKASTDGDSTARKPRENSQPTSPIINPNPIFFDSPVKTSVTDDGVIDIDVPLPDFLNSSFGSLNSSPSSSGYLSAPGLGPGLEGFEHFSRSIIESETSMNVGGWLPRYHPDFTLQCIAPQEDLEATVKESMRAEPTPITALTPSIDDRAERWVDISSTIIADTTNWTIKRIRYRRLVRVKRDSGEVYSEVSPDVNADGSRGDRERFVDEHIISMDETLIDAVERIIARSGSTSVSAASSRSASRVRSDDDGAALGTGAGNGAVSVAEGAPAAANGASLGPTPVSGPVSGSSGLAPKQKVTEVPRMECKKMVLNALNEIVRSVVDCRRGGEGGNEGESVLREGVREWLVNVEEAG